MLIVIKEYVTHFNGVVVFNVFKKNFKLRSFVLDFCYSSNNILYLTQYIHVEYATYEIYNDKKSKLFFTIKH